MIECSRHIRLETQRCVQLDARQVALVDARRRHLRNQRRIAAPQHDIVRLRGVAGQGRAPGARAQNGNPHELEE